eukprot:788377-Amphidinium_carterae.3
MELDTRTDGVIIRRRTAGSSTWRRFLSQCATGDKRCGPLLHFLMTSSTDVSHGKFTARSGFVPDPSKRGIESTPSTLLSPNTVLLDVSKL